MRIKSVAVSYLLTWLQKQKEWNEAGGVQQTQMKEKTREGNLEYTLQKKKKKKWVI